MLQQPQESKPERRSFSMLRPINPFKQTHQRHSFDTTEIHSPSASSRMKKVTDWLTSPRMKSMTAHNVQQEHQTTIKTLLNEQPLADTSPDVSETCVDPNISLSSISLLEDEMKQGKNVGADLDSLPMTVSQASFNVVSEMPVVQEQECPISDSMDDQETDKLFTQEIIPEILDETSSFDFSEAEQVNNRVKFDECVAVHTIEPVEYDEDQYDGSFYFQKKHSLWRRTSSKLKSVVSSLSIGRRQETCEPDDRNPWLKEDYLGPPSTHYSGVVDDSCDSAEPTHPSHVVVQEPTVVVQSLHPKLYTPFYYSSWPENRVIPDVLEKNPNTRDAVVEKNLETQKSVVEKPVYRRKTLHRMLMKTYEKIKIPLWKRKNATATERVDPMSLLDLDFHVDPLFVPAQVDAHSKSLETIDNVFELYDEFMSLSSNPPRVSRSAAATLMERNPHLMPGSRNSLASLDLAISGEGWIVHYLD